MPMTSRYVAVGKDERSLAWLTEHLPYAFAFVTTPEALNAQTQLPGEILFLVDDAASKECLACLNALASGPFGFLWLQSPGNRQSRGSVLAKPLRVTELISFIVGNVHANNSVILRECWFRSEERLLSGVATSRDVMLTERETNLLRYLVQRRGEIVSRDELFKNVWGFQAELDTHTLETHIYRLRGKLANAGEDPAIIETVEGGYRLV